MFRWFVGIKRRKVKKYLNCRKDFKGPRVFHDGSLYTIPQWERLLQKVSELKPGDEVFNVYRNIGPDGKEFEFRSWEETPIFTHPKVKVSSVEFEWYSFTRRATNKEIRLKKYHQGIGNGVQEFTVHADGWALCDEYMFDEKIRLWIVTGKDQ